MDKLTDRWIELVRVRNMHVGPFMSMYIITMCTFTSLFLRGLLFDVSAKILPAAFEQEESNDRKS